MPINYEQLVSALKDALRDDGPDIPLLIKRIPGICSDLRDAKNDLSWLKKATMGLYVLLGSILIAIAVKSLGL